MSSQDIVLKIKKLLPENLQKNLPQKIEVVELGIEESRRLNLIYRNKNKPTNVLSFYYGPDYGEILICPDIVKKEAKEQSNSQEFQMTWMILHGIIHLAGSHHEHSRAEERKFVELENKILAKIFNKKARS